jgi:hypothetical protein
VPKEQGRQQGKNCIASDSTKTTHFLRFNTRRSKIKKGLTLLRKAATHFQPKLFTTRSRIYGSCIARQRIKPFYLLASAKYFSSVLNLISTSSHI